MPFCIKCGTKLSDEAVFCSNCGYKIQQVSNAYQQVSSVPPANTPVQPRNTTIPTSSNGRFKDYITKIAARLNVQIEYSLTMDAYCFHRKEFMATAMSNYRYYFFVHHNDSMDGTRFLQFADRCFEDTWNKPHQSGVAANQMVIPLLCQDHVNQQVIACLSKSVKQKHTFASGMIEYPVVLELSSGKMFFPTDTPAYGCAIWPRLKKMCTETMYYYV